MTNVFQSAWRRRYLRGRFSVETRNCSSTSGMFYVRGKCMREKGAQSGGPLSWLVSSACLSLHGGCGCFRPRLQQPQHRPCWRPRSRRHNKRLTQLRTRRWQHGPTEQLPQRHNQWLATPQWGKDMFRRVIFGCLDKEWDCLALKPRLHLVSTSFMCTLICASLSLILHFVYVIIYIIILSIFPLTYESLYPFSLIFLPYLVYTPSHLCITSFIIHPLAQVYPTMRETFPGDINEISVQLCISFHLDFWNAMGTWFLRVWKSIKCSRHFFVSTSCKLFM